MSWNTRVKKTEYLRGFAEVSYSKGGPIFVRLDALKDAEGKVTRPESTYEISPKSAPDDIRSFPPGKYYVSLSADGQKLYSLGPVNGTYLARCLGFPPDREGKPAKPSFDPGGKEIKMKDGRSFTSQPRYTMSPRYRITGGRYKNTVCLGSLPYIFEQEVDTGYARIAGSLKQNEQVTQWLEVFDIPPLPYSDNMLPILHEALMEHEDKEVQVDVSNGFVNAVRPLPETDEPKSKAKKPAKKAKK